MSAPEAGLSVNQELVNSLIGFENVTEMAELVETFVELTAGDLETTINPLAVDPEPPPPPPPHPQIKVDKVTAAIILITRCSH